MSFRPRPIAMPRCFSLEAEPQAQLGLTAPAGPEIARVSQEVRRDSQVAVRIAEVGAIGEVEELTEHLGGAFGAQLAPITDSRVDLNVTRPADGVPLAVELDVLHPDLAGRGAGAAVGAWRERVEEDRVPIRVDVGVRQREGRAAHHADRAADDDTVSFRNFCPAADGEVVPSIDGRGG